MNDQYNLLKQADLCPTCERAPVPSYEPVGEHLRIFLRCPNGHPYVACGDDLLMAINMWNTHIQWRVQQDSRRMMSLPIAKEACFCGTCQKHTPTLVQFSRVEPHDFRAGYIIILKQCTDCHLVKSQREVA